MNYHTDSASYDHVFYPSLWKPLFLLFLFFGVPALCLFGLYHMEGAQSAWMWSGLMFSGAFLVGAVFTLKFSRKLAVGINQNGVYTWHVGFVPWKEIKECRAERTISSSVPVSICITLLDIDSFLEKSRLGRRKRLLFFFRGKRIRIPAHLVSARLSRLIELLKAYHREARNKELTWPMDML